jgi:hypothetical protein
MGSFLARSIAALGGLPVRRNRPVRGLHPVPEPQGKFQISTGGGQYPQWGAGGRELFYVSLYYKLMVVSLKAGSDSVEPSAPRELFPLPAVDTGFSPYDATRMASASWFVRRRARPRSR